MKAYEFIEYHSYIKSDQWKDKATAIKLMACIWRLSPLPLLFGNVHHVTYKNIGYERYLRDTIVISPITHMFIIHGVLSLFKRPGQQETYPNKGQKIFHMIYKLPGIGGLTIALHLKLFELYCLYGLDEMITKATKLIQW